MDNGKNNQPYTRQSSQRGFGQNRFLDNGVTSELGKLPPQAIEMEEAVLGALMIEKDAIKKVVDILKPESFYKDSHQIIYYVILNLFDDFVPIDLLTVAQQLRKTAQLEFVGGAGYIAQLTGRINSTANIEYHARIIAQVSIKRDLIKVANEILKDAFEDTTDVFHLLDKTEQSLRHVKKSISENFTNYYRIRTE